MKTVSQLDANGYFVSLTEADQSPLEEGVFLLPAGCVDALPGDIPPCTRAKFNGVAFVLENIPRPVLEPVVAPNPKDLIRAEIATLEASITPRRLRDAILTGNKSFIEQVDSEIALLRGQL